MLSILDSGLENLTWANKEWNFRLMLTRHSPYAEPTQNEVPLTLSHRRWETDDFVIIIKDVAFQKASLEKSTWIHTN